MHQSNKTFDGQHFLPRLPVPTLNETCDRYIRWLEPLLSEDEWRRTKKVVNEFGRPDGDAEKVL